MGESILNALMHLFAIVAKANEQGVSHRGKEIVEGFLNRYVNAELQGEYLRLFENYMEFYQREMEYKMYGDNQNWDILTLTETSKVCQKVKMELVQEERFIVFLRLLEFVWEDQKISEQEYEFIRVVAENFKISRAEFINGLAFVWGDTVDQFEKTKFLIIDNRITEWSDNLAWFMKKEAKDAGNEYKHMYCENLYGQMIVMYVESVNLFVFKYIGELNIYLEGNKIVSGRTYQLAAGSIIKGPNIKSIYYSDIAGKFLKEEARGSISFSARNIEFHFRNSQNGIQCFNVSEESGQLIGIMGGSGVGKSTLLNVLNGNLPLNSGEITINGYNIHRDRMKLEGLIGFVPQDDLLIEELTVFQNLYYNAKLCFRDFSRIRILKTVLSLVHDLDLYEIRNLKVGNPLNKFISGGQRKRLNIGLELMREPSILLVDEPTSGLSSNDSLMVMRLLKQQTLKGKLVIANIHQPSSNIFKMLDKLWILDRGGFPIYAGNPIDGIVYFRTQNSQVNASESECSACGTVNPDQILQIVETRLIDDMGKLTRGRRTKPEQWYKKYKQLIESKLVFPQESLKLPQSNFKIPGKLQQFYIFWIRNVLAKLSNRQYMLINLLEAPLLAVILGYFTKHTSNNVYVFGDNKNFPVFLFMSVVVSVFLGLTVSAEEIIRDRKILQRESFLNLSRSSYLTSKIIFLFLLSAIQTLLFVVLGNYILEIRGMVWSYWLILFTTSCFSNMVGLNISSGLNSVITIYILIPLILVPQLLLGGAMIRFDDLHPGITNRIYVPVVGDMMTTRWAYEALAVTQFKDNSFESHFFDYEKGMSDAAMKTSFLIPRLQSMLQKCERNIEFDKEHEETRSNFAVLRREIENLTEDANFEAFPIVKELNIHDFNLNVVEQTNNYLDQLKLYYMGLGSESSYKKDFEYDRLVDSLGKEGVYRFKQKYYNNNLADLVLNRNEVQKLILVGDRLVQKKDPVFMTPDSRLGRTHFYAPVKRLGDFFIDTYWFNLIIMWLGSCFLYLTLWFDVLRRFVSYVEGMKLVQIEKRKI